MLVEKIDVTPELAASYLENNSKNRPVRESRVLELAGQMARNEWHLTHQGIAFDDTGALADGQHRLHAVITSGCTVPMFITRGVPAKAQFVMDDHAKRSLSDVMSLERGEKICSRATSILKAAVTTDSPNTGRGKAFSKREWSDMYDLLLPGISFTLEHFPKPSGVRNVCNAVNSATICRAFFYVKDLDKLAQFAQIFAGLDYPTDKGENAPFKMRNILLTEVGTKQNRAQKVRTMRRIAWCIEQHQEGKEVNRIFQVKKTFPVPFDGNIRTCDDRK